ncbi:hypothetical protein BKA61DRAFT_252594 [Leptodontidium sp. MPI-SDFR-AT-0119]|nr:hypothetical protein BKA61DRAFT_252594 [Leptodontidium sp. MPI-SDFR-AT-0119]
MKTQHSFHATPRQYKTRIKKWGLEKKLKTNEMLAIVHLDKKRKREGKVTVFRVRKRTVQEEKIKRFVREHPRVCDASFSPSVASLSVISYNTTEDHSRTFRPMGQNLNIPADAPAITEAPSESQSLVVRSPEARSPHIEARTHDRAWFIVSWITGDRAYQNDAPFDQRQKHFVAQNSTSRSSTTDLASMKEFFDFSAAARTTSISSSSGSKLTDGEEGMSIKDLFKLKRTYSQSEKSMYEEIKWFEIFEVLFSRAELPENP